VDHPDSNPGSFNAGNNLYISNLSTETKESDLRELFGKFGTIKEVRIVCDPFTKESRGFGFVTFENSNDANNSVKEMDKTQLHGREIKVEKARRCRPHDSTPGTYCGPIGASSKYRMAVSRRRRRTPSPLSHSRRRSRSFS
jgi:transformer-2 protein